MVKLGHAAVRLIDDDPESLDGYYTLLDWILIPYIIPGHAERCALRLPAHVIAYLPCYDPSRLHFLSFL